MLSEALGLFGLPNPWGTRDSSSLMISEALGLFGLSNPCVARDSSSLMISEALRALWASESRLHPLQQFVDDF
jgi:topoisomerase IA-like protein